MKNSKPGLRALGLVFLSALSLTVFFAASAQAASLPSLSTPGEFQIGLSAALLATATGTQEGVGSLLVPGRNLRIECSSGKITNGKINSATDGSATVLFEGCVTWNLALTSKLPCEVLTSGETVGNAVGSGLALPILHGGTSFVLVEPINLNFAELELHGATCPLPLLNPVKGSVVAEVIVNDSLKPLIKFSETIQKLSGDAFSFGGFPAFIDGAGIIELTGAHTGLTLGVV